MDFLFLGIGLLVGALVGYLMARQKTGDSSAAKLQGQLEEKERQLQASAQKLSQAEQQGQDLLAAKAKLEEQNQQTSERLREHRQELQDMKKQLSQEFEAISAKVLRMNASQFSETSSKQLREVLQPFREKVEGFEKKVEQTYLSSQKEATSLKTQIEQLRDLNLKLAEDAENLTKALKGEKQKQGAWGEVILERILEESGLEKDLHYRTQVVLQSPDGSSFRPDVVIELPDNRHIIVDSKVSVGDYTKYYAATDEEERKAYLKAHLVAIKNHIRSLSAKRYEELEGIHSLDYVMMFIPIEPAFIAAVQEDTGLFSEALEQRVLLVTPSTLLLNLRLIHSQWSFDKQQKNAIEIATEAGNLYDKFVGYTEDMIGVGKKLDEAKGKYSDAMNKMKDGKGNVFRRFQKLKELGAKADKAIDQRLLGDGE